MHIIDHAIQIPVTPANMWTLVSNPENNPKWQADCRSIAYLNSIRRGIGMRWRYQTANGKDQVAEITAWYEGLGFEYTLVDGTKFTANKGRLRLQEVPEGTIVQWTFSYELGGPLAGLRNAISVRRQLDAMIVESLRNLFRVAKDQFKEASIAEAKSLMQEAPSVLERATYKPRHPSVLEEGKPRPSAAPAQDTPPPMPSPDAIFQRPAHFAAIISEPPIAEDDTRPNPILARSSATFSSTASVEMPTFSTASISEANAENAPLAKAIVSTPPPIVEGIAPATPLSGGALPPAEQDPPPIMPPTDVTVAPMEPSPAGLPTIAPSAFPAEPPLKTSDSSRLDKRDTATISVFELFGLPRPSMTQEMAAASPAPAMDPPAEAAPLSTRVEPETVPPLPAEMTEPSFSQSVSEIEPTEIIAEPVPAAEPLVLMPTDEPSVVVEIPVLPDMLAAQATAETADIVLTMDASLSDPAPTVPLPLPVSVKPTDDLSQPARVGLRLRLRRQGVKLRTKSSR